MVILVENLYISRKSKPLQGQIRFDFSNVSLQPDPRVFPSLGLEFPTRILIFLSTPYSRIRLRDRTPQRFVKNSSDSRASSKRAPRSHTRPPKVTDSWSPAGPEKWYHRRTISQLQLSTPILPTHPRLLCYYNFDFVIDHLHPINFVFYNFGFFLLPYCFVSPDFLTTMKVMGLKGPSAVGVDVGNRKRRGLMLMHVDLRAIGR